MKTVRITVEYADKNLSAYIKDAPIVVTGKNMTEIENNAKEAVEIYLETCKDMGIAPVDALVGMTDLVFQVDVPTFINYYSVIFTKAALSRVTGINERQLWHYAAGIHKPRQKQLDRIRNGIDALTKELTSFQIS